MELIYIEWSDAYSGKDWITKEQVDGLIESEMIIRQSGFLYHEDKKRIVLIGKTSDCDENIETEYGGVTVIPKTWIRKRIDLTKCIEAK